MIGISDSAAPSASSPSNEHPQFNIQSPYIQHDQGQQAPGWAPPPPTPTSAPNASNQRQDQDAPVLKLPTESASLLPEAQDSGKKEVLNPVDESSQLLSRGSTLSGQEEEAVVYNYTRMLQDPTGRLCKFSLLPRLYHVSALGSEPH
jgi:hypothetical protein